MSTAKGRPIYIFVFGLPRRNKTQQGQATCEHSFQFFAQETLSLWAKPEKLITVSHSVDSVRNGNDSKLEPKLIEFGFGVQEIIACGWKRRATCSSREKLCSCCNSHTSRRRRCSIVWCLSRHRICRRDPWLRLRNRRRRRRQGIWMLGIAIVGFSYLCIISPSGRCVKSSLARFSFGKS